MSMNLDSRCLLQSVRTKIILIRNPPDLVAVVTENTKERFLLPSPCSPIRPVGGLWQHHYTSWRIALMVLGGSHGRLHGGSRVIVMTSCPRRSYLVIDS